MNLTVPGHADLVLPGLEAGASDGVAVLAIGFKRFSGIGRRVGFVHGSQPTQADPHRALAEGAEVAPVPESGIDLAVAAVPDRDCRMAAEIPIRYAGAPAGPLFPRARIRGQSH